MRVGRRGPLRANGAFTPLLGSLFVIGAGVSFTFPATRVAAVDAVPRRYVALAAGVTQTSRYFAGMMATIAVVASLTALSDAARVPMLFALLTLGGLITSVAALGMPTLTHVDTIAPIEVA